MRLIIVRHGEAEAFFGAASDAARKLTPKGSSEVERLGERLAAAGFDVQRIISSPYVRAQQTAALLAAKLGGNDLITTAAELQPDGKPADAINLADAMAFDTVLLASHQPLVGRLLNLLVDKHDLPMFTPACCAIVEADVMATGCAKLISFFSPNDQ